MVLLRNHTNVVYSFKTVNLKTCFCRLLCRVYLSHSDLCPGSMFQKSRDMEVGFLAYSIYHSTIYISTLQRVVADFRPFRCLNYFGQITVRSDRPFAFLISSSHSSMKIGKRRLKKRQKQIKQ